MKVLFILKTVLDGRMSIEISLILAGSIVLILQNLKDLIIWNESEIHISSNIESISLNVATTYQLLTRLGGENEFFTRLVLLKKDYLCKKNSSRKMNFLRRFALQEIFIFKINLRYCTNQLTFYIIKCQLVMFSKHCTKKIVISLTLMKTSCFTMDSGLEKLILEYSFNKLIFLVRISV